VEKGMHAYRVAMQIYCGVHEDVNGRFLFFFSLTIFFNGV